MCQFLPPSTGGLGDFASESDQNSASDGGQHDQILAPQKVSPVSPKPSSTLDETTTKSIGQSTTDQMPVYPGNQKDIATQGISDDRTSQEESRTSSTTSVSDLIMLSELEDSKTGERHGRNSPPVMNKTMESLSPSSFVTIPPMILPIKSDQSLANSNLLLIALVVLILILLLPFIRLGQACKAKFLAGLQEDYKFKTEEDKEDSANVELQQEETVLNENKNDIHVPLDRAFSPKILPYSLSPSQLSRGSFSKKMLSTKFSDVDVVSLDSEHSLFSPSVQLENGAATVITTKAEVYVIDGYEGSHTPITTGIRNLIDPTMKGQPLDSNGALLLSSRASTCESKEEEQHTDPLVGVHVGPSNLQRFSAQYNFATERRQGQENRSPPLKEEVTNKSRRGSLLSTGSGWGKDSKSWGVRHTKSSLARKKVVEMMIKKSVSIIIKCFAFRWSNCFYCIPV